MKNFLIKIVIIVATSIFIPTFLITLSISRIFVEYEYSKEYYKNSESTFSIEEKKEYALVGIEYLKNKKQDKSILEDLNIYSNSEIDHLQDVKKVTNFIRLISISSGIILVISFIYKPKSKDISQAYKIGTLINIFSITIISLTAIISWDFFFIKFHEIFFPGGNWSFAENSTLIQLFPPKFWMDYMVFLVFGIIGLSITIVSSIYTKEKLTKTG